MRAVLAYDGGERALKAVAPWAQQMLVELHIVRVLNPKAIHETAAPTVLHAITPASGTTGTRLFAEEPPAPIVEDRGQAFNAVRTAAAEEIAARAHEYLGDYPIIAEAAVGTDVVAEIIAYAKRVQADLIVAGSHPRGAISHALLSSVVEGLIRHSPLPVVVVGPEAA